TGWDDRLDREIFEKYEHDKLVRVIIPIIARGDVLGTLETGYQKHEKPEISREEIADLKRLVMLAAVGLEQANLLTKLKDDIALRNSLENQLDALNEASIQILNSTTEREAIDHIFRCLRSIGYHKGMLSLVDKSNQCIIGMYALGENWQKIQTAARFELNGNNLLAHVLRSRSPRLSKNCLQDARWDKKLARKARITSQYIIPMVVKNEPIGTLQIDLSDYPDLVHGDEMLFKRRMKVLETFASQSAIAIRNVRSTFTIDRLQANIAETAHEFRSPLHNIMTQVGGLKDTLEYSKDEKEIDRFVNVIEEEIYRAKRQVDNSLLLSDRTRETLEYNFEEGYLQNVINDCVDAYKFRALERGIRLIVRDSIKKLRPIKFDHDKIAQAITNLIDNAVKYSYDHQYIDIIGFDDGTWIKIEVSDRGMGIPPQEFETIFKGFERSEARDKFRYIPGTGLGLKICKEIVEKHSGKIGVSSVPVSHSHRRVADYQDYKTSFRIQLPKYRKERLS
ncbi:MAG: ATP-binding protein, partial [bacterium]